MTGVGLLVLALLALSFLAGLYVASALGLVALLLGAVVGGRDVQEVTGQMAWGVSTSFTLVSIPLFVLMGEVLLRSGLTERVYRALALWLNRIPGGLLHTNVAACAAFAAISGSSAATAATVGSVALPAFRARGYSESLVLGSLAASGTLGILIPPSINLIVYGVLMETSIGQLYMAAVLPGAASALLYMLLILGLAIIRPEIAPREMSADWWSRVVGLLSMLPVAALVLLVLGTIYLGIATPTEAAAFGVSGAFVVALMYRRVNVTMLRESCLGTVRTSSMILLLLIAGFILQFVLSLLGIPETLVAATADFGLSRAQVLALLVVIYLLLGSFMETFAIMVTTLPIVLPILLALDINLIWFAIVAVKLTEIGQITPPYGLNLFILQGLRQQFSEDGRSGTIGDLYRAQLPFLAMDLVTLAIVMAFPAMTLWLPSVMRGH